MPLTHNFTITFSSYQLYASVDENKELLCVSTEEATYLYTNIGNCITERQALSGSYTHKFSQDGQYLISGSSG